jgi:hypothetical protein
MPEYDIQLDGIDFMLLPGSYKSYPDGNLYVDSRLGRQILGDFTSGMSGPKLNARNVPISSFYGEASIGSWPAQWPIGINAVGPAPGRVASGYTYAVDEPKVLVRTSDYTFIAAGTKLWRWDNSGAPTLRFTFSQPILDMAVIRDSIYIAFGDAKSISRYTDTTQAETVDEFGSTAYASRMATLGSGLLFQRSNIPTECRWQFTTTAGNGATRTLDGQALAMVAYDDQILVATALSIWSFTPAASGSASIDFEHWGVISSDGLQNSDDYAWFKVFQGRLMAWRGGRAMLYDKQRGWWRHAGLEGHLSKGAAIVNGWLIVSLLQRETMTPQLWGYNGSGWWLLDEAQSAYPASARGDRLIVWEDAGSELMYYDMDSGRDSATVTPTFTLDTALFDAGESDRAKYWRQIGVELARADPAGVGEWSFELPYSTDGGAVWTPAGAATSVSAATASVKQSIAVTSNFLRVRLIATQVSGLPPFVMSVWAEYETLNESVRRRRWQFKIAAADKVVTRDAALDGRNGQEIRNQLWDLFTNVQTVTFRDVDYQTTLSERSVRIIGLREEWHKPADQQKIGAHATFDVTIVEL